MKRLLILLALGACASPVDSEPERETIAGYFEARPDVHLYLYDDQPGTSEPEQFFISRDYSSGIGYWWGTYVEEGSALRFTLTQETAAGAPAVSDAAWLTRPTAISATVAGFGRLAFTRTANEPPGGR